MPTSSGISAPHSPGLGLNSASFILPIRPRCASPRRNRARHNSLLGDRTCSARNRLRGASGSGGDLWGHRARDGHLRPASRAIGLGRPARSRRCPRSAIRFFSRRHRRISRATAAPCSSEPGSCKTMTDMASSVAALVAAHKSGRRLEALPLEPQNTARELRHSGSGRLRARRADRRLEGGASGGHGGGTVPRADVRIGLFRLARARATGRPPAIGVERKLRSASATHSSRVRRRTAGRR